MAWYTLGMEKSANFEGLNQGHEATIARRLIEEWSTQSPPYEVEFYGKDVSVLILGETHSREGEIRKQIELIKKVRPDFVLHEFLNGWIYDPETRGYKQQEGREFSEADDMESSHDCPKELIDLANQMGFQIIGCDLTDGELDKIGRSLVARDSEKYSYSAGVLKTTTGDPENPMISEWVSRSIEGIESREEKMVKLITQYQSLSKKPIVIILGDAHRENLVQQGLLKKGGFGYVSISQSLHIGP